MNTPTPTTANAPANVHISRDDIANRTITTPLNSLAVIEVSGADAQAFLQGQFSNDVSAHVENSSMHPPHPPHPLPTQLPAQLNAYCNPKGRALALIQLVFHADQFLLFVPNKLAAQLVMRLKMFVMRDAVNIEIKPMALLGVINGDGGDDNNNSIIPDHIQRIKIDGVVPRQILLGNQEELNAIACAYQETQTQSDDAPWRLVDILSGIPQIYPQTVELFIPQMINLELIGGISFTKGCYPGQEIIARLRYLGKVKQRMFIGTVTDLENINPGTPIHLTNTEQKSGVIVDASRTGAHEYTISLTAPAGLLESEELRVGSPTEAVVTQIELPYLIPA